MLKLAVPQLLFNKTGIYRIPGNLGVEKNLTNGPGSKQVLILTGYTADTLPAEEKSQLLKILGACKLQEADILILPAYSNALRKAAAIQKVLIFGDLSGMGAITFPKNRLTLLDGVQVIKTESLAVLSKNDVAKKQLWGELKKMFGL